MVQEALTVVLNTDPDITVTHSAQSVAESLHLLEEHNLEVDVAVLDVRLGDGSGHDITRVITSTYPHIKVVLLTSFLNDDVVVNGYSSRASAIVLKGAPTNELITAIKDAAAGLHLINPTDARVAAQRLQHLPTTSLSMLSRSDYGIAELISRGRTDREIADELHFSLQTVKNKVSRILSAVGVENRTQLAVLVATQPVIKGDVL